MERCCEPEEVAAGGRSCEEVADSILELSPGSELPEYAGKGELMADRKAGQAERDASTRLAFRPPYLLRMFPPPLVHHHQGK